MGFFDSLYKKFFKKKVSYVHVSPSCNPTDWHESHCKDFSPENIYLQIPVYRAVIDYIGKSASQCPIYVFKDNKVIETDFLKQPNKRQTWSQFIFESVTKKLIYGTNVIVWEKSELKNLNKDDINLDEDGVVIPPKNGCVRLVPNPLDSRYGLSLLETSKKLAIRARENLDATANLIKNGGMAGIVSANIQNDFANAKLIEHAESELRTKFGGGKNYGKIAIVGFPVNYSQVALSASDLGIVDFYKFDLIDVCRIFSVPSVLLNDTEKSTYNNIIEAQKRFYREVIIPELMDLCDTLQKILQDALKLRGLSGGYVWFDTSMIFALQEDVTMQVDNALKLFDRNIISAEELKNKLEL